MRIAHPLWHHALVAGLLLAGCKSNKTPEPAPQPQAAATPAPATKPPAPAPAPAPTVAPVTDATLSYLEPSTDGKCRWVQHTPPGEPRTVFTLPSDCGGVKLAWSKDGKEGLVYLAGPSQGGKPQAWRVDLATGQGAPLSSPTLGTLGGLGFDAEGRPVALMEDPREGQGEGDQKQIVFEGKSYPAALDGQPGLAHAFRLEGSTWKRFETKDTSYGWDYAAEIRALEAYDAIGPTPEKLEAESNEAFKPVLEDAPELAALNAVKQTSDEGNWKQLETAGGPLYVWESTDSELPYLSMPMRIQGAKGLVPPEGLDVSGGISVATRGELVLVEGQASESQELARLWNAKTKKLVASLNGKKTVTFWPKH
ncbi:hypothetical protein [Archangium sp.]|jgi:hypothetical protein|uniref:hypothetical protein n=1 Tax=Archangium sp. TaxID=1872627 RepID=UPI002EDA7E24